MLVEYAKIKHVQTSQKVFVGRVRTDIIAFIEKCFYEEASLSKFSVLEFAG